MTERILYWTGYILAALAVMFFIVAMFTSRADANDVTLYPENRTMYCADDGVLEGMLAGGYLEAPIRQSFKDTDNGLLFTWWESNEDDETLRSWTLTVTYPSGKACMLASGDMNWQPVSTPYEGAPVW